MKAHERARIRAMAMIDKVADDDKMAERAIKGYIEYLEMELDKYKRVFETQSELTKKAESNAERLRAELAQRDAALEPKAAPVEPAEPTPEIKKGDKVGVIRAHGHGDKKLIGLEGVAREIER